MINFVGSLFDLWLLGMFTLNVRALSRRVSFERICNRVEISSVLETKDVG